MGVDISVIFVYIVILELCFDSLENLLLHHVDVTDFLVAVYCYFLVVWWNYLYRKAWYK